MINKWHFVIKVCVCFCATLFLSFITFSAQVITKDAKFKKEISPLDINETIYDESIDYSDDIYDKDQSIAFASPSDISEEEMIRLLEEAYKKEIDNAILSVSTPEVANLPTLYRQPSFHPGFDDHFGVKNETVPIFKVEVDNDEEKNNLISFTFDSAYINKYTYKILDILDRYDAKATFFMTYEFMKKNTEQVMEIIKRGHEIGNHSTSHPDFNLVTDAKVVAEVWQCHDFMKNTLGVDMCLFRFPYGSYSPRTVNLVKNLGYYPIQWTYDSVDWRNDGKEFLIKRFDNTEFLIPGAIILFHNGATYTPEALPHILDLIKERGLKCVKVSDLIYKHDFIVDGGHQISIK